ncbi:hypothetical protein Rhopal_002272-T1 [Rhodotorula paludigena]|uniref:Uncharacterized protein n=1 Tax=Rhodotorula paludigena TaxID=86838 RepID=A0AAV5GIY0_9BASI|nr:hypothetical protein Rhopal_002272-T1 [Rhodotorula paludigena]
MSPFFFTPMLRRSLRDRLPSIFEQALRAGPQANLFARRDKLALDAQRRLGRAQVVKPEGPFQRRPVEQASSAEHGLHSEAVKSVDAGELASMSATSRTRSSAPSTPIASRDKLLRPTLSGTVRPDPKHLFPNAPPVATAPPASASGPGPRAERVWPYVRERRVAKVSAELAERGQLAATKRLEEVEKEGWRYDARRDMWMKTSGKADELGAKHDVVASFNTPTITAAPNSPLHQSQRPLRAQPRSSYLPASVVDAIESQLANRPGSSLSSRQRAKQAEEVLAGFPQGRSSVRLDDAVPAATAATSVSHSLSTSASFKQLARSRFAEQAEEALRSLPRSRSSVRSDVPTARQTPRLASQQQTTRKAKPAAADALPQVGSELGLVPPAVVVPRVANKPALPTISSPDKVGIPASLTPAYPLTPPSLKLQKLQSTHPYTEIATVVAAPIHDIAPPVIRPSALSFTKPFASAPSFISALARDPREFLGGSFVRTVRRSPLERKAQLLAERNSHDRHGWPDAFDRDHLHLSPAKRFAARQKRQALDDRCLGAELERDEEQRLGRVAHGLDGLVKALGRLVAEYAAYARAGVKVHEEDLRFFARLTDVERRWDALRQPVALQRPHRGALDQFEHDKAIIWTRRRGSKAHAVEVEWPKYVKLYRTRIASRDGLDWLERLVKRKETMTTPRTDIPSLAAKESESDKLAARIDPAGVSTLPETSVPAPAPDVTASSPTHAASTAHGMEQEQHTKDDEAAESISKLATGFGGMIVTAPLAAIEKVSPSLAHGISNAASSVGTTIHNLTHSHAGAQSTAWTTESQHQAGIGGVNANQTQQTVKETVNPAIEQAAATVKPVLAAAGEKIKESAPSTVGGKAPPVAEQLSQVTENIKSSLGSSAPAGSTTHEPKTALDSLAAPGYVDAAKEAVRQVGDKVASVLPASFTTAPARETPIEAEEHRTGPHAHEKAQTTPTTIADNKSETGKNAEQTREVGDTRVANPFDDKHKVGPDTPSGMEAGTATILGGSHTSPFVEAAEKQHAHEEQDRPLPALTEKPHPSTAHKEATTMPDLIEHTEPALDQQVSTHNPDVHLKKSAERHTSFPVAQEGWTSTQHKFDLGAGKSTQAPSASGEKHSGFSTLASLEAAKAGESKTEAGTSTNAAELPNSRSSAQAMPAVTSSQGIEPHGAESVGLGSSGASAELEKGASKPSQSETTGVDVLPRMTGIGPLPPTQPQPIASNVPLPSKEPQSAPSATDKSVDVGAAGKPKTFSETHKQGAVESDKAAEPAKTPEPYSTRESSSVGQQQGRTQSEEHVKEDSHKRGFVERVKEKIHHVAH